jgi:hypothetical protein
MTARLWRGWTESANSEAYASLLETEVLPELTRSEACHGEVVLRRQCPRRRQIQVAVEKPRRRHGNLSAGHSRRWGRGVICVGIGAPQTFEIGDQPRSGRAPAQAFLRLGA